MKQTHGFTLIELLIVVAIIGILAAIAVPNFLNAQVKARVARSKSDINTMEKAVLMYMLDNNQRRPIDCDDPGSAKYLGGLGCGTPGHGFTSDIKGVPEFGFATAFMSFTQLRIFTTPIAYISSTAMQDTFCSGCAITYNTRQSGQARQPESFTFSIIGPDRLTGDWGFFFHPGGNINGIQYEPSNGLTSRGDIFVSNVFGDIDSNRRGDSRIGFN